MLLAALTASLAVSAAGAPPAPAVERDVAYVRRGGMTLRMDIARPAARARRAPAIVWAHGGGFRTGVRQDMEPYTTFFARRGWVAATIDYRLRPFEEVTRHGFGVGEGDARDDALAAIAHLRRNAARLGVDRDRIVIAGASAGGVTALNVATGGSGTAPVRAAIALAGYGHPAALDAGDPPLLLVHGDADRAVPFARALVLCAAAAPAGARCELRPVAGAGHRSLLADTRANARRALAWLRGLGLGR